MSFPNPFDPPEVNQPKIAAILEDLQEQVRNQPGLFPAFPAASVEPAPEPEPEPALYIDPACSLCGGVGYTVGGVRCVLCESVQP